MDTEKITHIIFGLNRTLIDWDRAQSIAFTEVNKLLPTEIIDVFWTKYTDMQTEYFRKYVSNQISYERYRFLRFFETLQFFDIQDIEFAHSLSQCFTDYSINQPEFFPGALELLKYLKQLGLSLTLLSNGPKEPQRHVIECLGLNEYFQNIYLSGETGLPKPTANAYFQVLDTYKIQASNYLMVGDDWNIDIEVARALGMQSYWVKFNAKQDDLNQSEVLYGKQGDLFKLLNLFQQVYSQIKV